jgi:hypothetical protein
MKTISIALNEPFLTAATALQHALAAFGFDLLIVDDAILRHDDFHDDPAIAARQAKANFASYLAADNAEPVLLLDANVVAGDLSALAELVAITADVAGVEIAPGRRLRPAGPFAEIPPEFPNFNSGVVFCRTGEIARTLSAAWRANYAANAAVMQRDEPNLTLALVQTGLSTARLDAKFNSQRAEGAVFFHSFTRPAPPRIFRSLTARQLRLWIIGAGLPLAAVETQLEAIEDATTRERARVEWEYATAYERTHPLVVQLGAALGLTTAQIDAAFIAAAQM